MRIVRGSAMLSRFTETPRGFLTVELNRPGYDIWIDIHGFRSSENLWQFHHATLVAVSIYVYGATFNFPENRRLPPAAAECFTREVRDALEAEFLRQQKIAAAECFTREVQDALEAEFLRQQKTEQENNANVA